MDYAQLSDNLYTFEYQLKQAERRLHEYVKKAAWSDEDCFQVDMLYEIMDNYTSQIEMIREMLAE